MSAKIDLTGKVFNRLTVLGDFGDRDNQNKIKWKCQCICGAIKYISGPQLKSGKTKSCGCLQTENRIKHGQWKHPLYNIWKGMVDRCTKENTHNYKDYGGRGITVCDRWLDVNNFIEDMSTRPEGTSIDRIDNNGNYEPSNCKWSTDKEQSNNRRSSRYLEYNGESKTLVDWSRDTGIKQTTIGERLRRGWTIEQALETPVGTKRKCQ